MDAFSVLLKELSESSGIPVSQDKLEMLSAFYSMLEEANRSFNLIRSKSPEEFAVRHFMDSLAVPALNLLYPGESVVDVGSGAGFPGVPIAILRDNLQITLLDSMQKRTHFLDGVVKALGLANVTVVTARAEDYAHGKGRERFQAALSRAVAPLNVLLEYTLPLVSVGGCVLSWKGPSAQSEIDAAGKACRILGGGEMHAHPYHVPGHGSFFIVETRKILASPTRYPRKAGVPTKEPIL